MYLCKCCKLYCWKWNLDINMFKPRIEKCNVFNDHEKNVKQISVEEKYFSKLISLYYPEKKVLIKTVFIVTVYY